ncbi:hypothetical protein [Formosa algae]|uniref:Uncharacterized protein n=1 Tax=Formosa algae TaxID=225843 RepID=A0A9X0YKQ7_9FLAO|nr:hypothetical protein [Formosa algae]MBP1839758.1 hypothetical protein [Formosa algae]MDQ0335357.1 hypothetical protein [Formosa algae]OEI79248.1 hypothetical protein AST99_15625 [Formosa algae]
MKAATVRQLKTELQEQTQAELIEICLRLSKFKKENKELLTYLLVESYNESEYINQIKIEMSEQFKTINTNSYHYIKKSVRKILRQIKTYARYSGKKETEVELLLFFCSELKTFKPSIQKNVTLVNLYNRTIDSIKKSIATLHEDLQYDYQLELDKL